METYDRLVEKWSPVLNEETAGAITDNHKRSVTAAVLENTEKALQEQGLMEVAANAAGAGTVASGGAADNWNPILISLVRRAMPNMMAYDVCGVQPMSGPTGLIFAMKSKYKTTKAGVSNGDEALFNEAAVGFSGDSSTTANGSASGLSGVSDTNADGTLVDSGATYVPTTGDAYTTAEAEALGVSGGEAFAEMGFTIEKATVTAKSRALKAEYTLELAQDLKAIHGLDAETELANILSTEILAEINREVIRTINAQAKIGARQANVTTKGIFDLSSDADGRWSAEKFKGLGVQLDREANTIAKETRRGKGNFIICSSDVASALAASGMLDYSPALSTNLNVDDTGNTFAGVLNGRIRVYIDPYAATDYINVGYKGTNPYDAGVFYCPYVPLTMVRAVGENDFQPRIGFKTRYGMASNPFVAAAPADGLATNRTNQYHRIFRVDNILT
ncbi:MAG: ATP-binding protein [Euryarchaeota archaeon]|nr:ATP-binding protein [Euryarchaeota archaeon]